MRVDAHHHLWTADYPWLAAPGLEPLRRDYTVTDLRHALADTPIEATALVGGGPLPPRRDAEVRRTRWYRDPYLRS